MRLKKRFSSIFSVIPKMGRIFGGKKRHPRVDAHERVEIHITDMVKEEAILEDEFRRAKSPKDKAEFRRERKEILIEEEIYIIQKSTKTTFPQFLKLHEKLRMKYKWYYRWHLLPYANKLHLSALGTAVTIFAVLIISSALTLVPKSTFANQEPKLVVTETNPEKTPCRFFFKSETGVCDQLWQKISDDEKGLRIRTKSGTAAGYQDILILGNEMSLFDGDKLVATAKIQPQEQIDGQWQDISEKSKDQNPNVNSSPNDQSSNEVSPSPTEEPTTTPSEPTIAPSESPTASPEAMIRSVIQRAHAADSRTSNVREGVTEETITMAEKTHLNADSSTTLENGKDLKIDLDVKTSGQGIAKKAVQKQTFSLPANPNGNPQRIVLNVDLKNYDIKSDQTKEFSTSSNNNSNENNNSSSSDQPSSSSSEPAGESRSRQYNQVTLDTSDYKGQTKIEEKASSDTVAVYFDEGGTTEEIKIDPIFTVTEAAPLITVDDGTRKWVFKDTVAGAPGEFYHTSVGAGADNLASTYSLSKFIGPGFYTNGVLSGNSQTLVENTPTRVKIRTTGSYDISPTAIDNYYTIYPDGHAFLQYSATVAGGQWNTVVQHYLNAVPQVQNHDDTVGTGHTFVQSDTSNNNYPGMAVVPYTSSEFNGVGSWAIDNTLDKARWWKTIAAATYTGSMVIDFSNYRATTGTRDLLKNDYRTPATLANFDKGSQTVPGDPYNEAEGAYEITADPGTGDAKFDFVKGAYTRYKPAFKITNATRAEDNYLVRVSGVKKTKGVDYNLSKSDTVANTLYVQWLSDVSADLNDFEIAGVTTGSMQMNTGSYVGNATDDRDITGVGFQPNVVIIHPNSNNGDPYTSVIRTSAMVGDTTAFLALNSGNTSNCIQALQLDGFQVGTHLSANAAGITYHWQAFKDNGAGEIKVGSYPGNGVDDHNITGIGFQPDVVWIHLSNAGANGVLKTTSLSGDNTLDINGGASLPNAIQALQADGFQVGTDGKVNTNGYTYWYVAWKNTAGFVKEGTYAGNDADNRDITGVGFQPGLVWVKKDNAGNGVMRPSTLVGDLSFPSLGRGASIANLVQALQSDGFQVGTDDKVNTNLADYYYVAFQSQQAGGNKIWDGGGANDNWSTKENWSDDVAPVASDSVVFGSTSTDNCIIDTAQNVASITIGSGYTGTITANAALTVTGDFSLEQGTYNANGQALNIGGSFSRVGGTFTHGNNTTTFNATYTGKTILSGGQAFYNLTFDGTGGGWTMSDNSTVANDFNATLGTVNMGSGAMTVSGNFTINDGNFNAGTSTLIMNGSSKNISNQTGITKGLNNLTISGTTTLTSRKMGMTGILTVDNTKILTIDTGIILEIGSGSTATINGTVASNTTGIFQIDDGATLGTGGILSGNVMFAATLGGALIAPARTYGGPVEFYNGSGGIARNATLGTAGSQTLNFSSNFTVTTTGAGTMTVKADTWNPTVNITGNVSFTNGGGMPSITMYSGASPNPWTIGGNLTLANGSINMGSVTTTVSGNVDLTTTGTFTAGTSTLIMNGAGKNLIGGGKALNKLTISGTITLTTSGLTITNTLSVTDGNTLTIDSGVNITVQNVTNLNTTGAITGSGTLTLQDGGAGGLSSGGTITAPTILYASNTNISVKARTYGGAVTIKGGAGNYTATLGTGQTIFQSDLTISELASSYTLTVKADTNNPTVNITGNVSFTKVGAGVPSITQYNGVDVASPWAITGNFTLANGSINMGKVTTTVFGNVDFTNGTVTAGSSTLVMNGLTKTLTGAGQTLNNLQIADNTSVAGSNTAVSGVLTVNDGKTLSISVVGPRVVTMNDGSTINLNTTGAIGGGGQLVLVGTAGGALPIVGTVSSQVQFRFGSDNNINIPARIYGGAVSVFNSAGSKNAILGTAEGQTLTFQSTFNVWGSNGSTLTAKADTYNPTINITGGVYTSATSGGHPSINMGSGTWTVSGNVDFTNGTVTVPAAPSTATLKMDGLNKTLTGASQTLNNLQISGNTTAQTSNINVGGTLTVDNGKIFTITTIWVTMTSTSTTTLNGTIDGTGTFQLKDEGCGNLSTGGTLSVVVLFYANSNNNCKIPARIYVGDVIAKVDGPTSYSVTLGTGIGQTIEFHNNFIPLTTAAGNLTVDASVYNPAVNISGNITMEKYDTGVPSISMGSGTWTASGNVDFTNGTVTVPAAPSTATLVMDGSGKALTAASNTLNNIDFNSAGTITLNDDLSTNGYLKITNGTVNATNRTLNIKGDFNRAGGTFTTTGSTVNLNGANASLVHGNTTFNNLTVNSTNSAGGRAVTIDGLSTTTAASLALTGAAGKVLTLQSSNGNNWTITPTAVTSSTYLNVSHSTNTGVAFCATHSTGDINNVGWQISAWGACVPPVAPSGFSGTADSAAQITWNWTDNSDGEDWYEVRDGAGADISGHLAVDSVSYIEGGLSANTACTRHASAINNFGENDSGEITRFTLSNDPGWASATILSDTSIKLDWISGGSQNGFRIYRGGPSGVGSVVYSGNDATLTDTGLAPETSYSYYIYSLNGDNVESTNYSAITAKTAATPAGPAGPSIPSSTPTSSPTIPDQVTVGEPLDLSWGTFYTDFSWLKLPDIHIPFFHLTIHLPNLPRITFHWPLNLSKFVWDFGDGYQSAKRKVSHTYKQVGKYLVKLKIRGDNGTEQEIAKTVTVVPPAPEITKIKAQESDLLFEGKAYPKSTVHLTVASNPIAVETPADSSGKFEYLLRNPEQIITAGDHEVTAYVTVKTTDNKQIKGITSKKYDFFVDFQGQLRVVQQQLTIWKYVAITAICILLIVIIYGLYWRKIFRLPSRR